MQGSAQSLRNEGPYQWKHIVRRKWGATNIVMTPPKWSQSEGATKACAHASFRLWASTPPHRSRARVAL